MRSSFLSLTALLLFSVCIGSLEAQIYPMNQQNPVSSGFTASSSTSSYQFGWRFKCNTGGVSVLRLGCNFPANTAKTVTLFDASTQQLLGQVSVSAGSGWQFTDLTTPIVLNNGSEYVVVGHTSDGYYYKSSPPASWKPTGDIQWMENRYGYTTSANTFPTNTISSHYGVCDIGYVKGLTVISSATMPSGAVATTYDSDIQADFGTPPYNWVPTGGTLPGGLTLTNGSNVFKLAGTPTGIGTFNFTVQVTDGNSDTATKAMTIFIMPTPATLPFTDDFSSSTGWQLGTGWARAPAQAYSAAGPNRTEPADDYTTPGTDNNILGHLIGADYASNMGSTVWATSPPFNCVGTTTVSLRFQRWLGVSLSDKAKIQVSNNGTIWNDVWNSPSSSNTQDNSWQFTAYDISTWAVGNPVVQVRFGIGPTATVPNTGWCIDDVLILDAGPELEVREGGPTGTLINDNDAVGGLRDFGQINTSTNSQIVAFTLTNNGTNTINFQTLVEAGPDSAEFYILTYPAFSIAPSQSTSFTVQFYSTTAGVKLNTIEIPHDAAASGTSPFEVNLRAEAVVPMPNISVNMTTAGGTSVAFQDPAVGTLRDFGNVMIGSTSPSVTIVITNIGTGQLAITSIDLAGTWWTEFAVNAGTTPAVLTNGQSHSFTVTFNPSSAGTKDAYVRIVHNDSTQTSPFQVPIVGEGIGSNPIIEIKDPIKTLAHNEAAAGARDFNSILVAASSTALTITVTNSGGVLLTVGTPVLGGTNPGDFSLNTTGFGPSIATNASDTFQITFTPTAVGTRTAIVSFSHNDTTVTSPFSIKVTGNGVNQAPILTVRENNGAGSAVANGAAASSIFDFGNRSVTAGPAPSVTVFLDNTGTADLILSTPDFNPVGNADYTLDTTGFPSVLAVNASATFTITFDPTVNGIIDAAIEFTHNDGSAGSPFVINITGAGISPEIQAFEGSLAGKVIQSGDIAVVGGGRDAGQVDVSTGPTLPLAIVIKNAGSQTLNITSTPTLTGVNAGEFTLDFGGFNPTVLPNADTTILIIFDPSLAGIKDASIEFTHDDTTNASPFSIPVLGTGMDTSAVQMTTPGLLNGVSGTPYTTTQMQAAQGTPAYIWSIYSGSMPPGLSIASNGEITGIPTNLATNVFSFTLRVADQTGATNERSYTIFVTGSALSNQGSGGSGGGCTANTSNSNIWLVMLGLLSLVAVSGLRRKRIG